MADANEVVFELKASEKGRFNGGSVAMPEGKTLDIGKRLKSKTGGRGRIRTSDPVEIDRLDRVEVLRRAPKRASKKSAKAATGVGGTNETGTDSNDSNGGNA